MAARDSDDDIRKYMPDFNTILRTADPAVAAAKRRAALDAPGVAEVITEIREDNEVTLSAVVAVAVPPRAVAVAVVSASPWSATAGGEIDKAALPSSLAPNAAPPVVRDAAMVKPTARKTAKKTFPPWASSVAAVIAVVGPCTFAVVLLSRPAQNGGVTIPSANACAGVSSFAAPGVTSAALVSTQVPSVPVVVSATPVPSVSAVLPPEPVRPKLGTHTTDPYDAAPPRPAKTVEPVAPPLPTQQPTALPAPGKSPVEGDRVFGN